MTHAPGRGRLIRDLGAGALLALLLLQTGCATALYAGLAVALSGRGSSGSGGVPAPEVTGVSPDSGSHGGGFTITVTGNNFPEDATMTVGGIAATDVTLVDGNTLTATVARSPVAGAVEVTVTNPNGGSGTLQNAITFTNALPTATVGSLSSPQSANIVFSVTLQDDESDLHDLLIEVSEDGNAFQTLPDSVIVSGSLQGLGSSPAGVTHNITWDSSQTFPAENASNVQIRVTPTDTTDAMTGTAGDSNGFDVANNTPPQVEILQPSTDAFDVALNYRVSDPDGNDTLSVTEIRFTDLNASISGNATLGSGQGIGSVPFSSGGTLSTSVWRSLDDLGRGNGRLVEIRITVSDGTNSASATTLPFFVSNGPFADQQVFGWRERPNAVNIGDVTGDGRPDLVAVSIGDFFQLTGRVTILENDGQTFLAPQLLFGPDLATVPFDPLPADPGAAVPGPLPNSFLTAFTSLSESALLDLDGDGTLDLFAVDSVHAPNTIVPLLTETSRVLTNAAVDDLVLQGPPFSFPPGTYQDVVAHQVSYTALQGPGGGLNVAGGTFESVQANFNDIAGHVPLMGPSVFPPAGPVGRNGTDLFGWFAQDVVAADLDVAGAPGAGRDDVVILHGIRQVDAALAMSDLRGCVVIRQVDAGGALGTPFYLDPTDMGLLPSHCAVADITSEAHASSTNPLAPLRILPGTPDIIVANPGDSSLTFYLNVAPSPTPGVVPPTYMSINLPMAFFNPMIPAGDTVGVAIGDLNGDNANDFLVVGQLSQTAFLFLYDPDPLAANSIAGATGGILPFRLGGVISLPEIQVGRPAIADVTNDGRNDLLVPMPLLNVLLVYENLGNLPTPPTNAPSPVFGPPPMFTPEAIPFPVAFQPYEVKTADLNADGRTDAVVHNLLSQEESVLYQTTQGTLDEFIAVAAGGDAPFLMAEGDVNGDGDSDLIVSMNQENALFVFQRDDANLLARTNTYDLSAGTLPMPPPDVLLSRLPFIPKTGDVDGDGGEDILVALEVVVTPTGSVGGWEYVRGNPPQPNPPPLPATIAAVFTGSFAPIGIDTSAGDFLYSGGVPDGIPDVCFAQNTGAGLNLYQGLGGGAFAPTVAVDLASLPPLGAGIRPTQVIISDFDGDGHLDVAMGDGDPANQRVAVFFNGGDPPLDPNTPTPGNPPGFIGYGQLPAVPQFIDVSPATASSGVLAAVVACVSDQLGGPGPQTTLTGMAEGGPTHQLNDSTADFVAAGVLPGMYVRKTSGAGSTNLPPARGQVMTVTPTTLTFETDLAGAGVAFAAGDGYAIDPLEDMVFAGITRVAAGIIFQTSPRSFMTIPVTTGQGPSQVDTGDLNGDGLVDFALPWSLEDRLAIYLQNPNPTGLQDTFFGPITLPTGGRPIGLAILDVDGDMRNDVVVSSTSANSLNVFLQR